MRRRILFPLAWSMAILAQPAPTPACPGEDPCSVPGGDYHAVVPDGWDGTSPLPAVIFFHGYNSSSARVVTNRSLISGFTDRGVLFVAPNGIDGSWAHGGSPSQARNEIAFVDALMDDMRARWPIDDTRLWVTGFSQGGSMAWDVACYRGEQVAAFYPVAGAFWRPHPDSCPSGPVNLRHVHGTSDQVVPMEGRPIGAFWHQGDVRESILLLAAQNGCAEAPDRIEIQGNVTCEIWDQCTSGRELQLCLHPGGHVLPQGWISQALSWAGALAER